MHTKLTVLAAALIALSPLTATTTAVAEPTSAADAASAAREAGIADVLRRSPGAQRISETEISMGPGLVMQFHSPNPRGEVAIQDLEAYCSRLYVCVFNNRNYNVGSSDGTQLNFTTCGREWNLGNVAFPGGGKWNDKVSSIINNQSTNTWSYFYDHISNNNWTRVKSVNANNHLANLALDTAEDGGGLNDRIDGVHVCGSVPSPWRPNHP